MALYTTLYYTAGTYDSATGTFTAGPAGSTTGTVQASDNENVPGEEGGETFEIPDNMSTTGALTTGGQYVGHSGDGWVGNQGGIFYYFSNSPVAPNEDIDVDPGPFDVVCFLEGTLIATANGEVPVERLRTGDLVLASRGGRVGLEPLVWTGRMTVATAGQRNAPVLIRAGALGSGVPARDLRVSPEHAVRVEDVLVPARLLVNGMTIRQDWSRRSATYHHLEIERHGLLLSDGAWTESYLDNGNRHLFGRPGLVVLRTGADASSATGQMCLPLVQGGAELDRIRARLAPAAEVLAEAV